MADRVKILAIKENGIIIYDYELEENHLSAFEESDSFLLLPEAENDSFKGFEYDGVTIYLKEWIQYKVKPLFNENKLTKSDFAKCGFYGNSSFGILQFKNHIGHAFFKNCHIKIESEKITESEEKDLFKTINNYLVNLSFDFQKPTFSPVNRIRSKICDLPYHKFLLIISKLKDKTLFSYFRIIKENPYKTLTVQSHYINAGEIDSFDEESIIEFVSNPSKIVPCKNHAIHLSKCLTRGVKSFFPSELLKNDTIDSFDNPENQFLKFLFEYLSQIIETYQKKLADLDFCDENFLALCSHYKEEVDEILSSSFLRNVGKLQIMPFNSTVLNKQEGYRQLFSFFIGLNSLPVIDSFQQSLNDIIENKSLDVLYENFCFFGFADMLCHIYEVQLNNTHFKVLETDFSKTLEKRTNSNYFSFPRTKSLPRVELHYNKNYCSPISYSKPFDPDISLEIFDDSENLKCIYIFDAKFKISIFDATINKGDNAPDYEVRTFKFDDICKMHAYRDALKDAKGAFILYPGTSDKIYYENINKQDELLSGVGAFHIRPGNISDFEQLQPIVKALLEINSQD